MKFALILSFICTMVAGIPVTSGGNSLSEFYITEPIKEITYIMGETATLTWINGAAVDLDITVLEGKDPSSMAPSSLKSTIKSSTGPGIFTLPINSAFDEAKTYCFQLVYTLDQQRRESYSARFRVTSEGNRALDTPDRPPFDF